MATNFSKDFYIAIVPKRDVLERKTFSNDALFWECQPYDNNEIWVNRLLVHLNKLNKEEKNA